MCLRYFIICYNKNHIMNKINMPCLFALFEGAVRHPISLVVDHHRVCTGTNMIIHPKCFCKFEDAMMEITL